MNKIFDCCKSLLTLKVKYSFPLSRSIEDSTGKASEDAEGHGKGRESAVLSKLEEFFR